MTEAVAEKKEVNRWDLVPYTRGEGIHVSEIGGDADKPFPHFLHCGRTKLGIINTACMDFCVVDDGNADIDSCRRVLKSGGYLCVATTIDEFECSGSDLVEVTDDWRIYCIWDVPAPMFRSCDIPKPAKTCAVVRYGAFGDMIQASSIFQGLKAQGYHITLYCSTRGYDVVMNDPHVDRFVIQDTDQVPNAWLDRFWEDMRKRYTKMINLSESVEGTLLAMQGRPVHRWPHALRHSMLNKNYLEITHEIAEVPLPPKQGFYATDTEKVWAATERRKIHGRAVLWTLAGSGIHKTWPYLDATIARLMLHAPDIHVILVGDELCKMLEAGWEGEPRVICKSGMWTIRETLSFLPECDLIIGPETGVMNAAGLLPVPKIVTLSHSSRENLTKHWVNCHALTPKNTACYPCHILHIGNDYCDFNKELGVAQCQADISVDAMWQAITRNMMRKAA